MGLTLNLFRLQQTDSRIDRINTRLNAIHGILADDETVRMEKATHQSAVETLESARVALTSAEAALESQRIKIEQTVASLYGIAGHSPKELQDLQNELEALRRYADILEDRLLEAMQIAEDAGLHEQTAKSRLDKALQDSEERNAGLLHEKSGLEKELETISKQRLAVIGSIPQADLDRYELLRVQKRGVAVAEVQEGSCSVCGSSMTPAQAQAARSDQNPFMCPSCGRILYAG